MWMNWKATGGSDQVSACLTDNNSLPTICVTLKINSQ